MERRFSHLARKLADLLDLVERGRGKKAEPMPEAAVGQTSSNYAGQRAAGGRVPGRLEITPIEVELLKALTDAAAEPAYLDWASLNPCGGGRAGES
jgi:hypothetical protein